MSEVKIITDHKWHNFKYRNEVPEKVLKSQFDYQDEEDIIDGFFKYRDAWYHIDMFMHTPMYPLRNWDGYHSDSFYSGVVIKLSTDGEQYQVGTYIG